ncbi:serine/threonine-protein kinase [Streptomyces griseoruber]|uniref:Serine/threonine protein kinase n=2 Tax=Streptomyces griseoruber TaxID=1943 RepID=A0A101SM23_9ACTN|nr:serine/threonine-protein kinase [Streptomyces griseoruber]KUN76369.1 serine/threonine protein kinase [Streptomyces griseoruber]
MSTWAVPGYSESLELGSGAGGRVVLALHEPTGVPVAVKYLSESLRTRPGFLRGFRAEAELLGGLHSPYVAGFYEYVEGTEGAAIVMELVDGVSLRTLLARQGPLTPESALAVLKGSLLGLADAHRAGVVHRDYKPANVLVTPEGASKLVDFGIAVDAGLSAGVAGTPAYMAPEQWTGAPASPAGDVYAATATFFECLTGHKPYPGDNMAQLAVQHAEDPVPVEEVPEAVRALVRRGLAKTAAERPSDAAAFVADLERAAVGQYGEDWEERGRGRLAALVASLLFLLPSGRDPSGTSTTTDEARTVLGRDASGGRLRPWRPTVPGAAVAAAAVLVALLLGQGVGQGAGAASRQETRARATTSPTQTADTGPPPSASASPSPSATESSALPSASPSDSAGDGSASPSAVATDPSASPDASWTAPTPSDSASPTTSPSPSPSPSSPTAVKDVTVSAFRQTGPATATTTITVTADGTGPVTITLAWFTGNAAGQAGTADGTESYRRSGARQYTLTVDHTFQGTGCYWTVQASTSPASADGGASQQLLTRGCELR